MQKVHAECGCPLAFSLQNAQYLNKIGTFPPRHIQPLEIYVDDETKLTLHGLQQYYVKLAENAKNRKLNDLLDSLEFNQVCWVVSCG